MADEKNEFPDLNEELPEDEAGDDFFSEPSDGEDLLSEDFGDADAGISTEEEGEESFEEVAEGDDLSIGDDDDFFSSEPEDDVAVEVEVEVEEEEFSVPEVDAGDAPGEESLLGDMLGDEGSDPVRSLRKEKFVEEATKKKKTSPLLVLLLLLAAGYGAYAYIIPSYFPELLSSSPAAPPVKAPAPKRIAVKPPQKQAAPKPVPAEEPKLALEKAKGEAVEIIEDEAPEPVKAGSIPDRPAPLEEEVKPEPEKALSVPAEKIRVAKADLSVKGDRGFLVQAGAFIFKSNIKGPISKIKEAGYTPRVETAYKSVAMNRLTAGKWDSFEEANTATLDLLEQGYRRAKVLPLGGDKFTVLIGSYYYKHLAVEESIILEVKGFDTEIVKKPVRMKIYHILLGPYATAEEVAKVGEALKGKGLETTVLKNKSR
jgi:hypothetical protein